MALEFRKNFEECRDYHIVNDQEKRNDDRNGKIGKVSTAPIFALIVAEIPKVSLAETGKIVAVACYWIVCGHLTGRVEYLTVDAEVIVGKELVLLVLDVAKEHIATKANDKSQDPADE